MKKQTDMLSSCTFDKHTGIYYEMTPREGHDAPSGRRSAKVFWDPRVKGWRLRLEHVKYISGHAKFYGKDKEQYPKTAVSITVTSKRQNVGYYRDTIHPLPAPHIITVFTYMINSGKWVPSATLATKTVDIVRLQVLWSMLMSPRCARPGDSARLLCDAMDPCDPTYMGRSVDDVQIDAATERNALLDRHPDMDLDDIIALTDSARVLPWDINLAPTGGNDTIPLHQYGRDSERPWMRRKVLSKAGIADGTVPPILSPQTESIMHRRTMAQEARGIIDDLQVYNRGGHVDVPAQRLLDDLEELGTGDEESRDDATGGNDTSDEEEKEPRMTRTVTLEPHDEKKTARV